jgi:hypothetical protein
MPFLPSRSFRITARREISPRLRWNRTDRCGGLTMHDVWRYYALALVMNLMMQVSVGAVN